MATGEVKITDLPAGTQLAATSTLVYVDTAANTTKKTTLGTMYTMTEKVIVPTGGFTMSSGGSAVSNMTCYVQKITPFLYLCSASLYGGTVLSNNTSSLIPVKFVFQDGSTGSVSPVTGMIVNFTTTGATPVAGTHGAIFVGYNQGICLYHIDYNRETGACSAGNLNIPANGSINISGDFRMDFLVRCNTADQLG